MKAKIFIYLFFSLCFTQVFSQDFNLLSTTLNKDEAAIYQIYQELSVESAEKSISFLNTGGDLYTLQVINYQISSISIGINTRLEEELPYESNHYNYKGFYYFDLSFSYDIGRFNLGFSIENFLNLESKDFSIDPNIETTNGIINEFYFSHEADTLIALSVVYNF